MTLSRRDFIGGAISLAALAAIGAGNIAYAQTRDPASICVRPPGGQDEKALLQRCIRCDRCRSVCPQSCIGVATIEDGIAVMRTPEMDFHHGYCTFCARCIDVCPTCALSHDAFADQVPLGCAQVQKNRCVAWRNPGSCAVCADVCPTEAIHISNGVPVVDASACTGCGLCVLRCPALSLLSLSDGSTRGIEVVPSEVAVQTGTTVEGK